MTRDNFAGLPPRPDPQTGEPFPPHSPAWHGTQNGYDTPDRVAGTGHKPEPPSNKGPVLAWYRQGKRGKLTLFVAGVAVLIVGGTVLSLMEGDPAFSWMKYWQLWVVVVVGGMLLAKPLTYTTLAAGADWFQSQTVRFGIRSRPQFISLYELRTIRATGGPATMHMTLADNSESIRMTIFDWQSDRHIWDLVYNGILHSVAAGARIDSTARKLLFLDPGQGSHTPVGPRIIDVTRLNDLHVWELMEDPSVRKLCDSMNFHGSAAEFRKFVPQVAEEMLTNPANPDWFTNDDRTGQDNSDSQ